MRKKSKFTLFITLAITLQLCSFSYSYAALSNAVLKSYSWQFATNSTAGSATPSGWTTDSSMNGLDDGATEVLGGAFSVMNNGTSYSKLYVSSNSWISYNNSVNTSLTAIPSRSTSASSPPFPTIHICSGDRRSYRIYWRTGGTSGSMYLQIRYEGFSYYGSSSTTSTNPDSFWEATFYQNSNIVDIAVGNNGICSDTNSPGSSGITNASSFTQYFTSGISDVLGGGSGVGYEFNTSSGPTSLSTPAAPKASFISATSINVSETSTTTNASSYTINVYSPNSSTFLESVTVASGAITSNTAISGLTQNTNYYFSIIAVGDGVNYANSSESPKSLVLTPFSSISVSIGLSGGGNLVAKNSKFTIVATTTNTPGTVTFLWNSRPINHCIGITSVSGTSNCNWLPLTTGQVTLSAIFAPSNNYYSQTSSSPFLVMVGKRSGSR